MNEFSKNLMNSSLDEAENWISYSEDKAAKNIHSKQQKEKEFFKMRIV